MVNQWTLLLIISSEMTTGINQGSQRVLQEFNLIKEIMVFLMNIVENREKKLF